MTPITDDLASNTFNLPWKCYNHRPKKNTNLMGYNSRSIKDTASKDLRAFNSLKLAAMAVEKMRFFYVYI